MITDARALLRLSWGVLAAHPPDPPLAARYVAGAGAPGAAGGGRARGPVGRVAVGGFAPGRCLVGEGRVQLPARPHHAVVVGVARGNGGGAPPLAGGEHAVAIAIHPR